MDCKTQSSGEDLKVERTKVETIFGTVQKMHRRGHPNAVDCILQLIWQHPTLYTVIYRIQCMLNFVTISTLMLMKYYVSNLYWIIFFPLSDNLDGLFSCTKNITIKILNFQ